MGIDPLVNFWRQDIVEDIVFVVLPESWDTPIFEPLMFSRGWFWWKRYKVAKWGDIHRIESAWYGSKKAAKLAWEMEK